MPHLGEEISFTKSEPPDAAVTNPTSWSALTETKRVGGVTISEPRAGGGGGVAPLLGGESSLSSPPPHAANRPAETTTAKTFDHTNMDDFLEEPDGLLA
jgi:hypothetical protein